MNFILIDSKMRAPVPLPLCAHLVIDPSDDGCFDTTIRGFEEPSVHYPHGLIYTDDGAWFPQRAVIPYLELISEADFMAEQDSEEQD